MDGTSQCTVRANWRLEGGAAHSLTVVCLLPADYFGQDMKRKTISADIDKLNQTYLQCWEVLQQVSYISSRRQFGHFIELGWVLQIRLSVCEGSWNCSERCCAAELGKRNWLDREGDEQAACWRNCAKLNCRSNFLLLIHINVVLNTIQRCVLHNLQGFGKRYCYTLQGRRAKNLRGITYIANSFNFTFVATIQLNAHCKQRGTAYLYLISTFRQWEVGKVLKLYICIYIYIKRFVCLFVIDWLIVQFSHSSRFMVTIDLGSWWHHSCFSGVTIALGVWVTSQAMCHGVVFWEWWWGW